ncbi:hypothetical protein [Desulfotruncus alcoholivorax]|uniref:hypothetical protein n=1 Tax=Desulfotruncus alcoholivorax TaxID=265477 RepID=UPI0012FEF8BF|nr:hypothetical protein [Desulfotruncus alcoholivorax]
MDLETWDKVNKMQSLKRATMRAVTIIFFAIVGSMILPKMEFITKYKSYLYIVVAAITGIEFYRVYHWYKKRLDCLAVIRDIKNNDINPGVSLKKFIVASENQIEISQKKIDFCKILFPVPFFTYWLGIYINKDDKPNKLLDANILGIDVATGLLFLSFIIVIIYVFFIAKFFGHYIDNKFYITEYKKALIEYEEQKI